MVVMWDKNVLGNALDNVIGNIMERSLLRIVKWSTSVCHFRILCVFGFSIECLQKNGPFIFELIMKYTYSTIIRDYHMMKI